jgi:hypothetical protein
MPSITRRNVVAALTGCIALGAIGGAVARTTQKNAPHLIVNNQTERELDVTTVYSLATISTPTAALSR